MNFKCQSVPYSFAIFSRLNPRLHSRLKHFLIFVLFMFLLALCFAPVLSPNYAVSDDFYHLARKLRVKDWFNSLMHVTWLQGRPLDGLMLGVWLCLMGNISDFVYIRLVGLFGAAAVAFCFYRALYESGRPPVQSFGLALCLITVPAFQVLLSWSIASLYVFPVLASYLAIRIANKSLTFTIKSRELYGLLSLGALCQLMGLCIYQPTSMLFWLFAAIYMSNHQLPLAEKQKYLLRYLLIFSFAAVLDVFVFEIAKACFGTASVLPQRSHFTNDPLGKLNWFLTGPLLDALNFQRLNPSPRIAELVAIFLPASLWLYFPGTNKEKLFQLLVAISLIPLSYLPNLAIAENFGTYRTQAALTPLLIYYLFLGCLGIGQLFPHFNKPFIFNTLALGAALLSLICTYINVFNFFVLPQTLELQLMRLQLAGGFGPNRAKHPILQKRNEGFAPFIRYDEFGLPSLGQPWVPEPATFLVRRELQGHRLGIY